MRPLRRLSSISSGRRMLLSFMPLNRVGDTGWAGLGHGVFIHELRTLLTGFTQRTKATQFSNKPVVISPISAISSL